MFLSVCLLFLFSLPEAVVILTGVSDVSELDEDTVARYERLAASPLPLNRLGRASLTESGLFSSYQVESLLDYRRRNGDILSFQELASVDGFNAQSAECFSLFLDFRQADVSSGKAGIGADGDFSASFSGKYDGSSLLWQWMGRGEVTCKTEFAEFSAAGAAKSEWSRALSGASAYGWNLTYSGHGTSIPAGFVSFFRECVSRVCIGNFNLRFGQGLAVWSGSFFNGQTTPASIMKRPSGVTPYGSYSTDNACFGAAVRFDIAGFSFSPFVDWADRRFFGANVAWHHRQGEVGLTICEPFTMSKPSLSIDFQQTFNAVVLYGEASQEAFVFGVRMPLTAVDFAVQAACSMYEHNVTSALAWTSPRRLNTLGISACISYFQTAKGHTPAGTAQLKTQISHKFAPSPSWTFVTSAKARLRALTKFSVPGANYTSSWPGAKLGLREDIKWVRDGWQATARFECQYGSAWALLSCIEAGRTIQAGCKASLFLQAGFFLIDDWDDRIYVYRRDAPLSFNSPAMYGRGCWAAAYAGVKLWRWLNLYCRADITAYPFARRSDTRKNTTSSAKIEIRCVF